MSLISISVVLKSNLIKLFRRDYREFYQVQVEIKPNGAKKNTTRAAGPEQRYKIY